MTLSTFDYYMIIINIVGFVLFLLNLVFYEALDKVLTIVSLAGGSLGIIVGILIFARKPEKYNMMSRVFVACVFVVQIVLFLIIKGYIKTHITLAFWRFFDQHKVFLIYLLVINIITLIVFGIDKLAAIEHRSRIAIITLLGLAFIGGSVGALIAMYAFRHKTQKDYFTVGVPLIMIMQVVVLFYLMNGKLL